MVKLLSTDSEEIKDFLQKTFVDNELTKIEMNQGMDKNESILWQISSWVLGLCGRLMLANQICYVYTYCEFSMVWEWHDLFAITEPDVDDALKIVYEDPRKEPAMKTVYDALKALDYNLISLAGHDFCPTSDRQKLDKLISLFSLEEFKPTQV